MFGCSGALAVAVITIGSGPVVGQTFPVEPGYTCPAVVNRVNWLGGDQYGDIFAVTRDSDMLSVVRTDTGVDTAGWDMNLQFECCGKAPVYTLGISMNLCVRLIPV
jgi:hypothetical protein